MVASMQHELLQILVKENPKYKNLLDPFHGAGITLVEGQSLGLEVWGIDINPYAHIITFAKLEGCDSRVFEAAIERITKLILQAQSEHNVKTHEFCNIDKWFREDVIVDLSIVRSSILAEPEIRIRRYFWLCFGEIVKKYSNTRTSTFKLHSKETQKIWDMTNNAIPEFLDKIQKTYVLIGSPTHTPYHLACGDATEFMKGYDEESFDIICTSPPYGDNATTVTYGQFSVLQLLWIDGNDFEYDIGCTDFFSKIDSMSLGGASSTRNPYYLSPILTSYLEHIASDKKAKVVRFYADYENSFRQMARLLKHGGTMMLTLGNRRVDGVEFPFIKINKDLAEHYGLMITHVLSRNIMNKRMPFRVSRLSDGKPVNSMSKETVLLFVKD